MRTLVPVGIVLAVEAEAECSEPVLVLVGLYVGEAAEGAEGEALVGLLSRDETLLGVWAQSGGEGRRRD